jgi:ATP-dependent DNA helicase, RecQ family
MEINVDLEPPEEGSAREVFEDPVAALAKERFGLDYLYPYQRLVAANVIEAAGPDAEPMRQIVLLPTGFGKSLCFQLPALLLPGPTLVIYPLLALMEDQRRRLDSLGIACAVFRGGQDAQQRRSAELAVERGEAKIVITNPESLASPRLLDFLKKARPSHVAIDEAHCVSEWGSSFRPAYLELGRIVEELDPRAASAFTATASPTVFEAVARILFGGSGYSLVEGDPDRPNIHYSVSGSLCKERSLERLANEMERPLLVFCSSREGTQMLSRLLRERLGETDIRFYHAGLERPEKKAIEQWFYGSERGILVSTCAYGMGVDKKNIRSVIHFEVPASVEAYLQEAGRAGRDGLPSRAVLVSDMREEGRLEREGDELRRSRLRSMLEYATAAKGCRRERLLDLLGAPREGRSPCSGCDWCDSANRSDHYNDKDRSDHDNNEDRDDHYKNEDRGAVGLRAAPRLEGEAEIVAFVSANARRFSREETLELLLGRAAGISGLPSRCAYWGAMRGWQPKDASRALGEALRRGSVRELGTWPWKGRLAPARNRGASIEQST